MTIAKVVLNHVLQSLLDSVRRVSFDKGEDRYIGGNFKTFKGI